MESVPAGSHKGELAIMGFSGLHVHPQRNSRVEHIHSGEIVT